MSTRYKTKESVLKYIAQGGDLKHARCEDFQADRECVEANIKQGIRTQVPEGMQDKAMLLLRIENDCFSGYHNEGEPFKYDDDVTLALARKGLLPIEYVPFSVLTDRQVALAYAKSGSFDFRQLPFDLCDDEDFFRQVFPLNQKVIEGGASYNLLSNKALCLHVFDTLTNLGIKACLHSWNIDLKSDREVAIAALRCDARNLRAVDRNLKRDDPELIYLAVKNLLFQYHDELANVPAKFRIYAFLAVSGTKVSLESIPHEDPLSHFHRLAMAQILERDLALKDSPTPMKVKI